MSIVPTAYSVLEVHPSSFLLAFTVNVKGETQPLVKFKASAEYSKGRSANKSLQVPPKSMTAMTSTLCNMSDMAASRV